MRSQLNARSLGALTSALRERLRLSRWIALVAATTPGVLSCSQADRNDAYAIGSSYRLALHLTTPPHLLPERAAYFAPIVDSAVLILRVDSAARDTVYATFAGELRHFPVVFRSLEDSTVLMAVHNDHITALMSVGSTDAGLELDGTRKHRVVSGTWHSLTQSSADSGDFTMSPGA